jgi:succinyl-diaminopimelate desuccinylase
MLNRLFDYLDAQSGAVIRWQREMTARPALGPENKGTGEEAKAAWLSEELVRLGLSDITRYDCPDVRVPCGFRPNIAARIPGKREQTLWVIGHMDVVPPGEDCLWNSPPYELRVDGDRIYGRGVEDNQQAIVTAMLAADALLRLRITPDVSLGLLFVADEETGMAYGLPHVLAANPALIRPDDMILVPDMGNREGSMIEVAEKSLIWFRITVTGKQCHASTPDEGINSLVAASACVLELERLYRIFRNKEPLFKPSWSTFVPSKKEANVENINTLPGRDVFYLDCRVLPEYAVSAVEEEVRAIAREVAARYGAQIAVEITHSEQSPTPTPEDAPVVVRLGKALKNLRGVEPKICGVGGQTVAAPLRHRGLHAAVWATLMPNAHAPNEHSRISSAIADAKVVLSMLFDEGHK